MLYLRGIIARGKRDGRSCSIGGGDPGGDHAMVKNDGAVLNRTFDVTDSIAIIVSAAAGVRRVENSSRACIIIEGCLISLCVGDDRICDDLSDE